MNENEPDKQKQAIALNYDTEHAGAPKVVAKGKGFIAEQILALAKKNSIPIYQNKAVSSMLMAVEIDREIPPELYQAVAEVLAYIYRVDQSMAKRHGK